MPRPPRRIVPGIAYHVLNRRVMRLPLFAKQADYLAFERILFDGLARRDAPQLLAYCLMPNHWHLLLWPIARTNLSSWMQWLTVTHTHRWHAHHHNAGDGPLYQGRFKSFPVEDDVHFLTVARYVESNALRAALVSRAQDWRWSSLWMRGTDGSPERRAMLSDWPVDRPNGWVRLVNEPLPARKADAVRRCIQRGQPFGSDAWIARTARKLDLQSTFHPRGRPRKTPNKSS